MAIKVSKNPALQRLAMLISMSITIALFTAVLIEVGKGKKISLCTSNKTITKTCWDWHLTIYERTFKCPFTLLFVSLLLFLISLSMFFVAGLTKCLCPELVLISHKNVCCRFFTQYYGLVLHLVGTVFALIFIIFMLSFSYKVDSCYYSADMMRNCTHHRSLCWMLCLVCIGFVSSLFTTMVSAFEARRFYVEHLDDQMCDQLYKDYISTSSSHEYLKTFPR